MKKIFSFYFRTPLVLRILIAFVAGSTIGILLWLSAGAGGYEQPPTWKKYIEPFGAVFVNMLKMIVIPVIFFSLIVGAASLPIKKFGRIGLKVIAWYLFCSFVAATVGMSLALLISPGSGTAHAGWESMAAGIEQPEATQLETTAETQGPFRRLLLSMFENPFAALSSGNFLPIIAFSILFGLAVRVILEGGKSQQQAAHLESLVGLLSAVRDGMFKLVDWILEYSPVGVLALSIMNFGLYGPQIVGPYISVTLGVIGGILLMVVVIYSLLLWLVTRKNPLHIFRRIQEAMIMALMTRSSAATLPVSMKVAREELKVREELASFSLPLGATINMDGVCVHLPMFAVLAANMFGFQLTPMSLVLLVITTVLASIGAGGVPGGSLMLLFIILETMGLNAQQVSIIVALALGINPILDMFETMNNITGDLVCTYVVAFREKLLDASE
jgi:proton glutamate symport protein